jgi:MerR family transcriptional regulator, thiopeptide resistance regulator
MQSIIPTLAVSDIAASIRFYTDVLGFEPGMTLSGGDGVLIHGSVSRGDTYLMFSRLNASDPHDMGQLGQGVVLYGTVADDEDIDAYFERAKSAGATVVQEPTDQFWGHRDWGVKDPDGYLLFISKVTREVSPEEMREGMMAGSPAD